MGKAEDEQKRKEEEAAGGPAGIAGGVLGMGAAIGGMIPSLLAGGREKDALRKMQAGQGAGAAIARQTASDAAARVVGASTAQPSSGRGGSIREGLRAADQIVQRGAQQASITGAREGLAATQMLRQNDLLRRNAFKTLGAGVGQGLAGIGGMLAASRDQGPVQPGEATDTLPGEGALLEQALPQNVDPETGLSVPSTATGEAQQTAADAASGIGRLGAARTAAGITPPTPEQQAVQGRFTEPGSFTGAMEQARTAGALQGPDASGVAAQQAANVQQLADTTAQKQDAAEAYTSAVSGKGSLVRPKTEQPPPWTSPEEIQSWIYNEVFDYNPAMNKGIAPDQGALLLMQYGFQPDWATLGVAPMSNTEESSGGR